MSLFDSFKDVYEKVFTTSSVNTDNLIFKLHYRVTVTALVIFSVVLSLGQVRFIYCSIHMPRILFFLSRTSFLVCPPVDSYILSYHFEGYSKQSISISFHFLIFLPPIKKSLFSRGVGKGGYRGTCLHFLNNWYLTVSSEA